MTKPGVAPPVPVTSHGIPVSELEEVAKFQGTEFKVGDILIVRSGFMVWYHSVDDAERERGVAKNDFNFIGVAPGDETKKWIWYVFVVRVSTSVNVPFSGTTTSLLLQVIR